jgi:integrase
MPKQIPPLTSAQVMNAKPIAGKRVELRDGMVPGLTLRVSLSGVRSWSLLIQGGEKRRYDVGPGLSLAEARSKALEIRAKVRLGETPAQPRRDAREAARSAKTLQQVIDDYGAGPGSELSSWLDQKRRMQHVFAPLLSLQALDLSEAEFLLAADKHGAKTSARNALAYARPMIRWASKRKLMQKGVAAEIAPGQTNKRDRVLDMDELRRVLGALGTDMQDRAARFMLWTLARREEVAQADWRHIDFDLGEWAIPGVHRKSTKGKTMPDLHVPLPRQAIAMLRELARDHQTGLVFSRLDNWDRWQKRMFVESDTTGWHRHDLRRTSSTFAGHLGISPHVVEIMLGHAQPHSALAGVYNLSRYTTEHREALQKLADAYDRIQSGEKNVVAFRGRA